MQQQRGQDTRVHALACATQDKGFLYRSTRDHNAEMIFRISFENTLENLFPSSQDS